MVTIRLLRFGRRSIASMDTCDSDLSSELSECPINLKSTSNGKFCVSCCRAKQVVSDAVPFGYFTWQQRHRVWLARQSNRIGAVVRALLVWGALEATAVFCSTAVGGSYLHTRKKQYSKGLHIHLSTSFSEQKPGTANKHRGCFSLHLLCSTASTIGPTHRENMYTLYPILIS